MPKEVENVDQAVKALGSDRATERKTGAVFFSDLNDLRKLQSINRRHR
jgi:hypothetical protein